MSFKFKRDPNKLEIQWNKWKSENQGIIEGVSQHNSKIILAILKDMENGENLSKGSVKGFRSPARLLGLKNRLLFFAKHFTKLDKVTKEKAADLFKKMRDGQIVKSDGKMYEAPGEYVKDFKCLSGWLHRTGKNKIDVGEHLQRKDDRKPPWVYMEEEQIKKLANDSEGDYRALIWFFYDSGIRAQEGYSIKVSDFSEDYTKLSIRGEIAKTFGRNINLKLCSQFVKEYVQRNNLNPDDYFVIKSQAAFNKYLRTHAKKLFGDVETKAKSKYSEMRITDIRHNASCYWLKRYPKQFSLMHRMGWERENEIKYYSEFLGMSDTITDEDMVTSEQRTAMEKATIEQQRKIDIMQKQIGVLAKTLHDMQMEKIKQKYPVSVSKKKTRYVDITHLAGEIASLGMIGAYLEEEI